MKRLYHSTLGCRGSGCRIADFHDKCGNNYEVALLLSIPSLARKTKRDFGPKLIHDQTLMSTQSSPPVSLPLSRQALAPLPLDFCVYLVDPLLHSSGNIWLSKSKRELESDVFREVVSVLLSEHANDAGSNNLFRPEVEILLWSAVNSYDRETLTTTLKSVKRDTIPQCVLSSLLHKATVKLFDSGVAVLLQFGASRSLNNSLNEAIKVFLTMHNEEDGPQMAIRLTAIVKSHLDSFGEEVLNLGDDRDCYRRPSCQTPFFFMAGLARFAPDAAGMLIEAIPPHYNPFDARLSPIHLALKETLYTACTTSDDCTKVMLMKHAVVPLLKAGAFFRMDPFESDLFVMNFAKYLHKNCDPRFRYTVGQIIIEARRTGSLNVEDFTKIAGAIDHFENSRGNQTDCLSFANLIHGSFPRTLQITCRLAILRCLPVGPKARRSAIEKLQLPPLITRFIRFETDFTI